MAYELGFPDYQRRTRTAPGGYTNWIQPGGRTPAAGGVSEYVPGSSMPGYAPAAGGTGGYTNWIQPGGRTPAAGGTGGYTNWIQPGGRTPAAGGTGGYTNWIQPGGRTPPVSSPIGISPVPPRMRRSIAPPPGLTTGASYKLASTGMIRR